MKEWQCCFSSEFCSVCCPCVKIWCYAAPKLRKLIDNFACLKGMKKTLWYIVTVGYDGGKYLVLVDADIFIFALFFMAAIACASECYLWWRFQMCFTERLRARDDRTSVGQGGGQKKVEGNANLWKTKKSLPVIRPVTWGAQGT